MAPFDLVALLGVTGSYLVYLAIGFAFGFILESAGFGDARKLAAQFYFSELTVLKVMFTAIIVAMTLIFLSTALGLLDYDEVWVNPTYLWPGIAGGIIMGIGFILGGYCPGTSLVSAATLKIDGMFFLLGLVAGVVLFGETVSQFAVFFESSFMGRFTLPELFGLSYGSVVLAIVVVALLLFWGAEKVEAAVGGETAQRAPRSALPMAGALVALAVAALVVGQPTNADRWRMIEAEQGALLEQRAVQIEPAELLSLVNDSRLKVLMIDVRDERHYNQFHIHDARLYAMDELVEVSEQMMQEPANTVFVTISNDEARATEAWKVLKAESLPNVYILEGGVNNWIRTYGDHDFVRDRYLVDHGDDEPAYRFELAIGARHPAAEPLPHGEAEFEQKVKLELKRAPTSGGCG